MESTKSVEWGRIRILENLRHSEWVLPFISLFANVVATINALCIKCVCVCVLCAVRLCLFVGLWWEWAMSISLGMTYNKGGNRIQSAHYLYYTFSSLYSLTKQTKKWNRIDNVHAQANPFVIKVPACQTDRHTHTHGSQQKKNFTIKHKKIK